MVLESLSDLFFKAAKSSTLEELSKGEPWLPDLLKLACSASDPLRRRAGGAGVIERTWNPWEMEPPSPPPPNSSSSSPLVARALGSKSPRLQLLLENCRSFAQLKAVHAHMLRTHLFADVFCASRLLALCTDRLHAPTHPHYHLLLRYAERVFSQVPDPNLFMHNALIRACCRRAPSRSLRLFRCMLRRGISPDNLTFPFVLIACVAQGIVGRHVHAKIIRAGFSRDPFVQSSLLRMYAVSGADASAALFREIECPDVVTQTAMIHAHHRAGDFMSARKLFDEMPVRSVATWSCMICGYAKNQRFGEALDLFLDMRRKNIRANEAAMAGVLASCSNLGTLEQGRMAHRYILRHHIPLNPVLGTTLIDMYAKCGDLEQAMAVFRQLPPLFRDWLTWTTMISALALHGRARSALDLFSEMESSGVSPTEMTFTAALTACSHGGLVEEGLELFERMKGEHGMRPGMEHYGCVVDLLGRAGRVEEAESFVREMPVKADGAVLGALLGACRIHRNAAAGERVGKMLTELCPDHSGYHLLAAQVSAADDWEAASWTRKTMEMRGARKKEPGHSILLHLEDADEEKGDGGRERKVVDEEAS